MTHKILCASSKDGKDAEEKKTQSTKKPQKERCRSTYCFFSSKSPYKMVFFPILITSSTGKG